MVISEDDTCAFNSGILVVELTRLTSDNSANHVDDDDFKVTFDTCDNPSA